VQTETNRSADDIELAKFLKRRVFGIDAIGVRPDELRRIADEIAETLDRVRSEPIPDLAWDDGTP
jgi:hypothetical protein